MNSTLVRRATTMRLSAIRPRSPRILQHNVPQQRLFAGAAASVTVPSYNRNDTWWTTAAAAAAMAGGTMLMLGEVNTKASCEKSAAAAVAEEIQQEKEIPVETPAAGEQKEEEEDDYTIGPDDPYYNIPEQDEPTDCSMCLTFRQGPCRVDWKRFELCVKDKSPPAKKEGDEEKDTPAAEQAVEDPTACMKYAMPFYHCSSKHVNSYLILGNDQTQQTVTGPLMDTYKAETALQRRLCFAPSQLALDWTNWETFVRTLQQLGGSMPTKFQLDKTGFNSPADALRATWKDAEGNQYLMMNDEGEPFLITVTVQIPIQQPMAGIDDKDSDNTAPLMMTYALDQKGNLVGDSKHSTDEEENQDNNEKETPTHLPLQVQIVPGVTQEVTIYALYVPKEGDFLDDGTLYESKPYKLQTITDEVIEKAKQKMAETQAEEGGENVTKKEL